MAKDNITKASVDRMRPGAVLWDSVVSGFAVRCQVAAKVYVVKYRTGARQRWHTIGKHGAPWTPQVARNEAKRILGTVAGGGDPAATRDERKAAGTLAEAVARFKDMHIAKLRSSAAVNSLFDRFILPRIGTKVVCDVRRRDVAELLDDVEGRAGPRAADKTLAAVRSFFNWHARRDSDFISPIVPGMARTRPGERARDRVLSDDEIRLLWPLLNDTRPLVFGAVLRVLLLTGQRRSEVAGMRWDELDTDDRLWTIPALRFKSGRLHAVPLTQPVWEIIAAQPRLGEYVFSTTGRAPVSGYSKAKATLDSAMAAKLAERDGNDAMLPPRWTLHDLRRTAMSLMTRHGIPHFIADRVLGHALAGVGAVYDRHGYLAEKRHALETLARAMKDILNPHARNKVVPLAHARHVMPNAAAG